MLALLLLLVLIILLVWYCWHGYSPYFSFYNYNWLHWNMSLAILRGRGPKNEHLNVYLPQDLKKFCKKHLAEEMAVAWLPRPTILIYGPEAIKFFANERSVFDKPAWVYDLFDVLDKEGLLRSSGKRARKQRRLLSPAFYPSMMKNYLSPMNDHARYFVEELRHLEDNTTHDLIKIIKPKIFKSVYEVALGHKTSFLVEDDDINIYIENTQLVYEFLTYRIFRPWLRINFMLHMFPEGRNYIKQKEDMYRRMKQLVEELKESYMLRTQSTNMNDTDQNLHERRKKYFGDVLIEEHLKDPSFTMEDVQTEIITLTVASYDASSHTLMWLLWLLGLHHDVQEKAHQEAMSITNDVIEYEDLQQVKYMECIIKEILRLYTPAPVFARQSNKDLYYGKHKIPSGSTIAFLPHVLHRNPELYPEPEKFNPDRFLGNESNVKPWTYMPFGESVRGCIGKHFAMLELKVLLAHLVRNFRIISLTPREKVDEAWEILLKCSVPLSVKFIPR